MKDQFKGDQKALLRIQESVRAECDMAEFIESVRALFVEKYRMHASTIPAVQAAHVLDVAPALEKELD